MDPSIYPLNIYYESACPLCNAEMTNLQLRNTTGLLRFTDISVPGFVPDLEGVSLRDMLELIHAQRADGTVIKGVEVFRLAYAAVGIGWVNTVTRWPLISKIADGGYRWLARTRHLVPAWMVDVLFATALRRAAEQAALRRCAGDTPCACANPGTKIS